MNNTSNSDQKDDDSEIEVIESEAIDSEVTPPRYELVTFPADYTLEGLVAKYKKGQVTIPGFQRNFVWTLPQASKLIESFLLGLPVPAIFLYTCPADNTLQVIDGQQRLLSISYFFDGLFGPEDRGKRTVFALKGLHEKSPYAGKTYEQLGRTDVASFNHLNDAVLRAFVIKQLDPGDSTSIYHIFERLNTGGTGLVGQEIRNCVYDGTMNALLGRLNTTPEWRAIYGKQTSDKRQRDVELILRFFALSSRDEPYAKPMKDFLSRFMHRNQNINPAAQKTLEQVFVNTVATVNRTLGSKPFHIRTGLNAAVYDSVMVAFSRHPTDVPSDIESRYSALIKNDVFLKLASSGTTDEDVVARRLQLSEAILFGGMECR